MTEYIGKRHIDTQDVLLVTGFGCLESGVGMIYLPAALILAGVLFFIFALLIEISKRAAK
jgi:hypothetical protein